MSSDSLAAFRRHAGEDLARLAEEHIQHDLTASDRDRLSQAASKFTTYTTVGSVLGLALGGLLAIRLRRNRVRMYQAFRATEKPTHLRFADGREVAIPDVSPLMKPSVVGDVATYVFFAGGGILFGGELGLLTGSWAAKSTVFGSGSDPESRKRILDAFRSFKIDVLKKQIQTLENGANSPFGSTFGSV